MIECKKKIKVKLPIPDVLKSACLDIPCITKQCTYELPAITHETVFCGQAVRGPVLKVETQSVFKHGRKRALFLSY